MRKSDIRVVIYSFGCEMKSGISIVIYRIKEGNEKVYHNCNIQFCCHMSSSISVL